MRVIALPIFTSATADPKTFIDWSVEMSKIYDTDKIRVQSIKIHPEGNWTSGVAPFLEPYTDTPDSKGGFNVQPEVTRELFLLANAAGLDVLTHTDGDASTRAAVDAWEAARKAGYTDARNALHHLIWTHPDDPLETNPLQLDEISVHKAMKDGRIAHEEALDRELPD